MIELLFPLLLAFGLGYTTGQLVEECPRRIQGWSCRGKSCNHNKWLVKEARAVMREQEQEAKRDNGDL